MQSGDQSTQTFKGHFIVIVMSIECLEFRISDLGKCRIVSLCGPPFGCMCVVYIGVGMHVCESACVCVGHKKTLLVSSLFSPYMLNQGLSLEPIAC